MKRISRVLALAITGLVLVGAAADVAGAAPRDRGRDRNQVTVYGLTADERILTFSLDDPGDIQRSVAIRGLNSDKALGLDRRPANNIFYTVTQTRRGATLYTVDPRSGRTQRVADLVSAPTATNPNRTPITLSGDEFGFDFNPAADALRIVSDTGQNLRVIPSARTAPDGTQLQPGDTFVDGTLNRNGQTVPGVTAAAYTNNDTDPATATTLYDIDHLRDELSIQNPPNTGTLTNTVPLGRRTDQRVGFDIRTTAQGDLAVASLSLLTPGNRANRTRLVVVDLATGNVDSQGRIFGRALRDIALAA
jgi:uncharacterized protein DUF4394